MGSQLTARRQWTGLVFWLLVTFVAAALGSMASLNADTFYLQLDRPGWTPPAAVFGPVWSVLYVLMGISAWRVWRTDGFGAARLPLLVYLAQLTANALWSWLFFKWNLGAVAFAEVLLLWVLVMATLVLFWRRNPLAGGMLIPYGLWVSYASVLNFFLWQMNPELL